MTRHDTVGADQQSTIEFVSSTAVPTLAHVVTVRSGQQPVDVTEDVTKLFDVLMAGQCWAEVLSADALLCVVRLAQRCALATPDEIADLLDRALAGTAIQQFQKDDLVCARCGNLVIWQKHWLHFDFSNEHPIGLWYAG